jgi:hypothetical protein
MQPPAFMHGFMHGCQTTYMQDKEFRVPCGAHVDDCCMNTGKLLPRAHLSMGCQTQAFCHSSACRHVQLAASEDVPGCQILFHGGAKQNVSERLAHLRIQLGCFAPGNRCHHICQKLLGIVLECDSTSLR